MAERATAVPDALAHLVDMAEGDARAALTTLELALALADADGRRNVTLQDVERARQTRVLRYGEDDHYDVISAFIKSIRGSDPDAGLYWLARMLEAGEDARFIARRLVILASEDVGMADSMGLVVADAAARAVEFVGLPEAALNLAHAVIYLAAAPKSNTAMAARFPSLRRRDEAPGGSPCPRPCAASTPTSGTSSRRAAATATPTTILQGSSPRSTARRRSRETSGRAERRVYYRPSPHGQEAEVARRLRSWWGDAPLRHRGMVGVREVPGSGAMTGGRPGAASTGPGLLATGSPGLHHDRRGAQAATVSAAPERRGGRKWPRSRHRMR